jgi:hypothetical protein
MITQRQYYRVDRKKISLLKFTFEAYEGVAVVTTVDARRGTVFLAIAPGCEQMVRNIMADLGTSFMIEPWDEPAKASEAGYKKRIVETDTGL